MSQEITITAEPRESRGKNEARRLRVKGLAPGVLYGANGPAVAVSVNPKELTKILHSKTGHNTIFNIQVTDVDRLRERSLRYLFPDISTQAHLEHTVRLVATGRVRVKPTITHVLIGIDAVPEAFEITANKGKYRAINPAQVVMRKS